MGKGIENAVTVYIPGAACAVACSGIIAAGDYRGEGHVGVVRRGEGVCRCSAAASVTDRRSTAAANGQDDSTFDQVWF